TMRLLTGDDRAGTSFADAFLRASRQVAWSGAERSASRRQSWGDWGRQLRKDADWLGWPLLACAPSVDPWLRGAPGPLGGIVRRTWTERALPFVRRPSPDQLSPDQDRSIA
ncbi:MAG TPA: hypothetical protein VJU61_29005, partial [Polyangiaceae bacterium]|nr:hypothetical protein [Polyangiaceae bacterium]